MEMEEEYLLNLHEVLEETDDASFNPNCPNWIALYTPLFMKEIFLNTSSEKLQG